MFFTARGIGLTAYPSFFGDKCMNIGDRFYKDGKLIEVTSIERWGYGFREVTEEVFKATPEPVFKAEEPVVEEPVFPAEETEEVKEEKPVRKPRKRKV
jgi:hypothetical protein